MEEKGGGGGKEVGRVGWVEDGGEGKWGREGGGKGGVLLFISLKHLLFFPPFLLSLSSSSPAFSLSSSSTFLFKSAPFPLV